MRYNAALFLSALFAPLCGLAAEPLSSYPTADAILLTQMPALVTPADRRTIEMPMAGTLRLHVAASQRMKAGDLWGEFEATRVALESKSTKLAREVLNAKKTTGLQTELTLAKMQLRDRIRELDRGLAMLEIPEDKDSPLKSVENGAEFEAETKRRTDDARKSLNEERAALQAKLTDLEPAADREMGEAEIRLTLRESDNARLVDMSRLVMPYDGTLTIQTPMRPGVTDYRVNANEAVAVIENSGRYFVKVDAGRETWRMLPDTVLEARIHTATGGYLVARLPKFGTTKYRGRDTLVATFEVPAEQAAQAQGLANGETTCEIWQTFTKPTQSVPTLTLLTKHASAFKGSAWRAAVEKIWPGYTIAGVGLSEVAITKK